MPVSFWQSVPAQTPDGRRIDLRLVGDVAAGHAAGHFDGPFSPIAAPADRLIVRESARRAISLANRITRSFDDGAE